MGEYDIHQLTEMGFSSRIIENSSSLLINLIKLVEDAQYIRADEVLVKTDDFTSEEKRLIRRIFSDGVLAARQREWGNHGIWRSFRFWSVDEKISYLTRSNAVIKAITPIADSVCYGFGSVLGFIRNNGFIPHDDDMDVIVAFHQDGVRSFQSAKILLMTHLSSCGMSVYNENKTHFTVNGLDVFIGFVEHDGGVAWYPGRRNSGLSFHDIFPHKLMEIHGVQVRIPKDTDKYLNSVYGVSWREENSTWSHSWNLSEYSEYC